MLPTPDAVSRALAAHSRQEYPALPGRTNHLRAGVLVPLIWHAGGVRGMLTLRAAHLGRHAGEVAWPGGRPEPADLDLEATAVREAREEVGAAPRRMLGRLSSVPLYTSDFRLEPFVAEVADTLVADGGEVARLLPVELTELYAAPHIHALAWEHGGEDHRSPVWELAPGTVLFGATAHVLLELLQVLAPVFGARVPPLVTGRFTPADLGLR